MEDAVGEEGGADEEARGGAEEAPVRAGGSAWLVRAVGTVAVIVVDATPVDADGFAVMMGEALELACRGGVAVMVLQQRVDSVKAVGQWAERGAVGERGHGVVGRVREELGVEEPGRVAEHQQQHQIADQPRPRGALQRRTFVLQLMSPSLWRPELSLVVVCKHIPKNKTSSQYNANQIQQSLFPCPSTWNCGQTSCAMRITCNEGMPSFAQHLLCGASRPGCRDAPQRACITDH